MQFLRSTLLALALASPLAGCLSYSHHEYDEGRPYYYEHRYYGDGYSSGYYGGDGGVYYYRHED
jgi:hypothetical protein